MYFKKRFLVLGAVLLGAVAMLAANAYAAGPEKEIRQYQGVKLSPFDREYDNSIKGPQKVDPKSYRLTIEGLVQKPLSLTYEQVLKLPHVKRVVNLPCVEGWDERLLFEGVLITDLLALAEPKAGVRYAAFFAADGYSSALPLEYLKKSKALLGFKINGRTLNAERGFPFQVVAEHKLGYKWVKWVSGIRLLDKPSFRLLGKTRLQRRG